MCIEFYLISPGFWSVLPIRKIMNQVFKLRDRSHLNIHERHWKKCQLLLHGVKMNKILSSIYFCYFDMACEIIAHELNSYVWIYILSTCESLFKKNKIKKIYRLKHYIFYSQSIVQADANNYQWKSHCQVSY